MMTTQQLQEFAASLAIAKLQAEADAAQHQKDGARLQAEAVVFGLERAKRPSSLMAPLIMYYDDVGCRWAASYGVVGETVIAYLPSHITETGVTAYGATPEEAMLNFDKVWLGGTCDNDED
jgi:hypothetical protein